MKLNIIKIQNFKSFSKEEIHLDRFNVMIGANASGKSNFVHILRFIRDLSRYGIENAVYMQGGLDFTLNLNLGRSEKLNVELIWDADILWPPLLFSKGKTGQIIKEIQYCLTVDFSKSRTRFDIDEDKIIYRCEVVDLSGISRMTEKSFREAEKIGEADFIFEKRGEITSLTMKTRKGDRKAIGEKVDIKRINEIINSIKTAQRNILLQQENFWFIDNYAKNQAEDIAIYDFDPKLSKKAQLITGKVDLEEDGSNLAVVVNSIVNTGSRRKFYNILESTLPFVESIHSKRVANTLVFHLREKYYEHKLLPGFLLSDGTINLTALITALFFQKKTLKVIEEPGRNIHPYLISRVLDMMRDASENEQILTTSHNPEVVRYAYPNEILLAKRSDKGVTNIYKPIEKEEIKAFLNREMGMSELYVQRLLEEYT